MIETLDDISVYDLEMEEILQNRHKFIAPITNGRGISAYDGDTIKIAQLLNLNGEIKIYEFTVRIKGIDCPEIRTKNHVEKQCSLLAKQFVHDSIYNKRIELSNIGVDKYGRVLADVEVDGMNLAQELIRRRFAVSYDGNKKSSPADWMIYHTGVGGYRNKHSKKNKMRKYRKQRTNKLH
jgi:micrococcal nuclease